MADNRDMDRYRNQKSRYLIRNARIALDQVERISEYEFMVPSETEKDKSYYVNIEQQFCDCFLGKASREDPRKKKPGGSN